MRELHQAVRLHVVHHAPHDEVHWAWMARELACELLGDEAP